MELAPPDLPPDTQVPFLSVGQEVGTRTERCRGQSALSGEYVVEDVEVDGDLVRRLIFLDRPHVSQTEARLRVVKARNKKPKKVVDATHLATTHHSLMIGSLGSTILVLVISNYYIVVL